MILKQRLQHLEDKIAPTELGCNCTLLVIQYEGEGELRPPQEQIDRYLNSIGACNKCQGKCLLCYDGQNFNLAGDKGR